MQKQAPSIGRIMVAVGFALSCFGLLLFLWIAFGGPIPLKPKSYRVTAYFPEGTQLAQEGDVRIGGVSVGRVKSTGLAPPVVRVNGKDVTEAEIEIRPEFAPISEDAKAILRQKTLLGETYVELTSGTEPGQEAAPVSLGAAGDASDAEADGVEAIPEGGTLGIGQTVEATQIDEIFNVVDAKTRQASRRLLAESALALGNHGLDLSDALGNLGPFLEDAHRVARVVREQRRPLRGLIRDTGLVLRALSRDDRELAGAITGAEQTFGGFADANEPLAESIGILPTFERELRLTLGRLDEFQAQARPVTRKLLPVAADLSPTLDSVRRFSPHLRDLLAGLDPLLDAAREGFPALHRFLRELRPVLAALDPALANLNPIIRYVSAYRSMAAGFLTGPPTGLAGTLPFLPGQPAPRHSLRVIPYVTAETLGVYGTRLPTNRGNGYVLPENGYLAATSEGIFPSFDCKNTDYTETSQDPDEDERRLSDGGSPPVNEEFAACVIQEPFPELFGGGRYPNVTADP